MQDELKEQYLRSLVERIDTIKGYVRDYRSGDADIDQKIRLLAHSLHGSGATFGFPAISEAAKEVEFAPEKELIKKLTQLVKVLKEAPAKQAEVAANTYRILMIDDDPENAQLIQDALAKQAGQYQITVAETAAAGEVHLVKSEFALILLDLVLPDRDGREILREIRLEYKLPTPVFVLSAIERDVVRVECMSLGASKFFLKPYDPHAVALAIDQLLRKAGDLRERELSLVPLGSEPGAGQRLAQAAPPETKTPVLTGLAVLVAEDDMMQAANIKQRLSREGFVVDVVDNGKAALDALQRKSFALVILDVRMPVLDGFEVLTRIRQEASTKRLPVIMLTAMGSEAEIIKGYDMGADDYILKPYSAVQLVARVKSLLKNR